MTKSISGEVLSREGSSTYRLGQSVVVPGVWLSPPQGSRFDASSYKALEYALGSLHKAYSVQQGIHQGTWQFLHFGWSKFSDCQQYDTKPEI